jgi:hypothetical protein
MFLQCPGSVVDSCEDLFAVRFTGNGRKTAQAPRPQERMKIVKTGKSKRYRSKKKQL